MDESKDQEGIKRYVFRLFNDSHSRLQMLALTEKSISCGSRGPFQGVKLAVTLAIEREKNKPSVHSVICSRFKQGTTQIQVSGVIYLSVVYLTTLSQTLACTVNHRIDE